MNTDCQFLHKRHIWLQSPWLWPNLVCCIVPPKKYNCIVQIKTSHPWQTYIVNEQTAVIGGSLLCQKVDVQSDHLATISMNHTCWSPIVTSVDGTRETIIKWNANVHVAGFTRRRDLGDEIGIHQLGPYLKINNIFNTN